MSDVIPSPIEASNARDPLGETGSSPRTAERPTFGERAYGKTSGRLRYISQGDLWSPLPDHEVYNDQRFEHYGPCRVSKAQL